MHISFDFDYTLADSSEGTVVCANFALATLGLPQQDPESIRKTIGLSLERTFVALTQIEDAAMAADFKAHFFACADREMQQHIHLYPETAPTLIRLHDQGHYLSIVSTKLKKRIDAALARQGLAELIDLVVGGDCMGATKPDPAPLKHAMAISGVAPAQTLYLGDSVSDGECAERAGVAFVGVLTGKTTEAQLRRWSPQGILAHVGELKV